MSKLDRETVISIEIDRESVPEQDQEDYRRAIDAAVNRQFSGSSVSVNYGCRSLISVGSGSVSEDKIKEEVEEIMSWIWDRCEY